MNTASVDTAKLPLMLTSLRLRPLHACGQTLPNKPTATAGGAFRAGAG